MAWTPRRLHLPRRRWLLLFVVAVIPLAVVRVRDCTRFGPAKFDRLHVGMTQSEITAALGCEPGDYRPSIWQHPTWYVSTSDAIGFLRTERGMPSRDANALNARALDSWCKAGHPFPCPPDPVHFSHWLGRWYGIDVGFDRECRAVHLSLWDMVPPRSPHDIPQKIRWWLGW